MHRARFTAKITRECVPVLWAARICRCISTKPPGNEHSSRFANLQGVSVDAHDFPPSTAFLHMPGCSTCILVQYFTTIPVIWLHRGDFVKVFDSLHEHVAPLSFCGPQDSDTPVCTRIDCGERSSVLFVLNTTHTPHHRSTQEPSQQTTRTSIFSQGCLQAQGSSKSRMITRVMRLARPISQTLLPFPRRFRSGWWKTGGGIMPTTDPTRI